MRQGALSTARGHPCIEHLDGDGFERHRALGAELADRNAQPRAVLPEVHQAVEFKVEQLADADAGGAQKDEPSPSEWVVEVLDGSHERGVGLWIERARHRFGQSRQVGEEEQASARAGCPSPGGDVFEEHPQVNEVVMELSERDRAPSSVGAAPWAMPGPC